MARIITEDMIEQAAIKALEESQGYDVLRCYTEDPETLPGFIRTSCEQSL